MRRKKTIRNTRYGSEYMLKRCLTKVQIVCVLALFSIYWWLPTPFLIRSQVEDPACQTLMLDHFYRIRMQEQFDFANCAIRGLVQNAGFSFVEPNFDDVRFIDNIEYFGENIVAQVQIWGRSFQTGKAKKVIEICVKRFNQMNPYEQTWAMAHEILHYQSLVIYSLGGKRLADSYQKVSIIDTMLGKYLNEGIVDYLSQYALNQEIGKTRSDFSKVLSILKFKESQLGYKKDRQGAALLRQIAKDWLTNKYDKNALSTRNDIGIILAPTITSQTTEIQKIVDETFGIGSFEIIVIKTSNDEGSFLQIMQNLIMRSKPFSKVKKTAQ